MTTPENFERIWTCKIGGPTVQFQRGADLPMRIAVQKAFKQITGLDAEFCFSGWGGKLTEPERAVVENRPPSAEYEAAWNARPTSPQPPPVAGERETFEAWGLAEGLQAKNDDRGMDYPLGRVLWKCWQARAALAQPVPQPLTDDQIDAVFAHTNNPEESPWVNWRRFARAIHGIKGTDHE